MNKLLHQLWEMLKEVAGEWDRDNVSQLAAALAFYTTLSLAPLMILALSVGGIVFGQEAARHEILRQVQILVGSEGTQTIQVLLKSAGRSSALATLIGIGSSLFGATIVFVALQDALNRIWDVQPKAGPIIKMFLRKRLLSFVMILSIGFLLLASFFFSTALMIGRKYMPTLLPVPTFVTEMTNSLGAIAIFTILFALIYKVLPDAHVGWNDVWIGSLITSVMFEGGRYFIGLYLSRSGLASIYGAAGSFVIFLVWVYYSSQVFLLGGEIAQIYARRFGSGIVPEVGAERINPKDDSRKLPGIPQDGNGSTE